MRRFNTSGPCDPDKHYTVMREALVASGQALVDDGRYFTLFAPRQAGKTTYFQLLLRRLEKQAFMLRLLFDDTPIPFTADCIKTKNISLRQKYIQMTSISKMENIN